MNSLRIRSNWRCWTSSMASFFEVAKQMSHPRLRRWSSRVGAFRALCPTRRTVTPRTGIGLPCVEPNLGRAVALREAQGECGEKDLSRVSGEGRPGTTGVVRRFERLFPKMYRITILLHGDLVCYIALRYMRKRRILGDRWPLALFSSPARGAVPHPPPRVVPPR